MGRSSKRTAGEPVKLEMTPMIDVVFQLLIFFIVTLKQEDILSSMQVMRPGRPVETQGPIPPPPFTIVIDSHGFIYNGRGITEKQLRETIERFARYDRNKTIAIKATLDSPHEFLIRLLDICALNDVNNIAVFSIQQ